MTGAEFARILLRKCEEECEEYYDATGEARPNENDYEEYSDYEEALLRESLNLIDWSPRKFGQLESTRSAEAFFAEREDDAEDIASFFGMTIDDFWRWIRS